MAAIPGHLCVVLASVSLDVSEVRRQLTAAIATADNAEREPLIETAAQLLALENAIGIVLGAQGELESSPLGEKP
jgi:predicted nuclease of restriction endonuclease-like RecB superfamily